MIARSAKVRLLLPRAIEEESPHHQASTVAHLPHLADDPYILDPAPPFPSEEFLPPPEGEGETLILRSVPLPSRQVRLEIIFLIGIYLSAKYVSLVDS